MPYKSRKTPSSRENSHIRPIAVIWVKEGHSVNVPKNKMAYEVIMVYHLRMPFFIAIFLCFLKKNYPTGHGAPEEV